MDRAKELERELRDVQRHNWRMRVTGVIYMYWLIVLLTHNFTSLIATALGYGLGTLPYLVLSVIFLVVSILLFVKGKDIAVEYLAVNGIHPPK